MSVFTLSIVTPQGFLYQGEVRQVIVPAVEGRMGILAHHTAILAALMMGEIEIQTAQSEDKIFNIQSGYVKVVDNTCTILAAL